MGANNHEAGRLGGAAIGKYAKDTWNCDYTAYVSLESTGAGAANAMPAWAATAMGSRSTAPSSSEGHSPDVRPHRQGASAVMSDVLPALPGNKIIVVAINEDGIVGRHRRRAPRSVATGDVFYSGQGSRSLHLEGHRLQPELHRLRGVLPRELRQDDSSRR